MKRRVRITDEQWKRRIMTSGFGGKLLLSVFLGCLIGGALVF